jgi:hypothetical protein
MKSNVKVAKAIIKGAIPLIAAHKGFDNKAAFWFLFV